MLQEATATATNDIERALQVLEELGIEMEEEIDEGAIILQGLRRAANSTNWRYRASSMTTSHSLDILMS